MTTSKKEFSAVDAAPMVMHGKKDLDSQIAYPLKMDSLGNLLISAFIPGEYDYILLDPPSQPTTITFKTGGSGGTTVATLTLTYSGSDIVDVTRT